MSDSIYFSFLDRDYHKSEYQVSAMPSAKELAKFFELFGLGLCCGLPTLMGIKFVALKTENIRLHLLLFLAHEGIRGGAMLAEVFQTFNDQEGLLEQTVLEIIGQGEDQNAVGEAMLLCARSLDQTPARLLFAWQASDPAYGFVKDVAAELRKMWRPETEPGTSYAGFLRQSAQKAGESFVERIESFLETDPSGHSLEQFFTGNVDLLGAELVTYATLIGQFASVPLFLSNIGD